MTSDQTMISLTEIKPGREFVAGSKGEYRYKIEKVGKKYAWVRALSRKTTAIKGIAQVQKKYLADNIVAFV